jgi:hypothetical protein
MDAGELTCPNLQIFFFPAKAGETENAIKTRPAIKILTIFFI